MIAAAHKSSGKTTISIGLSAALSGRGLRVQTFKKGPDYIDPMWLSSASKHTCYNLDFNAMNECEIKNLYALKLQGADISLVEANKGLYDGIDLSGIDSNAQLAKLLQLPVVLVIDTTGMTRGIAPLLLGYQAFDEDINIAGVILNKVGGSRHEEKLIRAVEYYSDITVIGAIGRNKILDIGERHLGLVTPNENNALSEKIAQIGRIVGGAVDLDKLQNIASNASNMALPAIVKSEKFALGIKIGVIKDSAFGFYYADDLEAFEKAGAKLIFIDSLQDQELPQIDGFFIGGGFPEIYMERLSANEMLRANIKKAIENGLPTYAECGGLMYLCNAIKWGKKEFDMVGVIEAKAIMNERPQGRGYTSFEVKDNHLWGGEGQNFAAHEFHYASIEGLKPDTEFARIIKRGHGIDGQNDGIIKYNLMAGFCHLRNCEDNSWVRQFLTFVKGKTTVG